MEYVTSIIGIVTGLAAIFTFVTGHKSLAEFRQRHPSVDGVSAPVPRRLYILVAIFGILIAVTLAMGLTGDDLGGLVSLLLSIAGIAVVLYEVKLRDRISPGRYGAGLCVALVLVSLAVAPIADGEEGFAIALGVVVAFGTWGILHLLHKTEPVDGVRETARPPAPHRQDASEEKTIIEIAAQMGGQVRTTDIALGSDLSLDQADRVLDSLCARNHCRKVTKDSGAVIYEFPNLLGA